MRYTHILTPHHILQSLLREIAIADYGVGVTNLVLAIKDYEIVIAYHPWCSLYHLRTLHIAVRSLHRVSQIMDSRFASSVV